MENQGRIDFVLPVWMQTVIGPNPGEARTVIPGYDRAPVGSGAVPLPAFNSAAAVNPGGAGGIPVAPYSLIQGNVGPVTALERLRAWRRYLTGPIHKCPTCNKLCGSGRSFGGHRRHCRSPREKNGPAGRGGGKTRPAVVVFGFDLSEGLKE